MKKKILIPLLLVSALSLGAGISLLFQGQKLIKTNAYTASSLPTTINLNDTSASNIRSYYSSLNDLSSSDRQGTNLLGKLKTILKNNQKYYSYESGTNIWRMYEITDRDWDLSPASSISGYNSSTNTITGYTYGDSVTGNQGTNPYVHALYNNRNVTNQTRAWDSHGDRNNAWTIEREHVWPKSQGFDNSGAGGARGDPMHLMAANGTPNGAHSNHPYGYVDKTKSYTDCGSTHSNIAGNYTGKSKTLGGSGTVFEPQDSDKGDIARAIFYMAARYNKYDGETSFDTNDPNLGLVNEAVEKSSYTTTTASTVGEMGILQDLLEWNRLDPPDEFEIHRNNLLYTNFTNNRNPFIDFPEWAEYIWGKSTNGSYSSSSTGYAKPSSDTLNDFSGGSTPDPVAVTGVSLNKNSTTIEKGSSETLVATVSPANATNQAVTWTSNNTSVATVSNGTVTAVSEGNATITVKTVDGNKTATCSVTVTDNGGSSVSSGDASLFSGSLEEGDYVIYYGGKALKNTVSSNRFDYVEVTPDANDVISQPASSIVWHIAQSGSYWTIYNSEVSKYAAGNGTSNKGALITDNNNYAKWTVAGNSTYEFVNYGNTSDSVNANLRNNGTYGFACYSTSTGGALSLYKVQSGSATPTSITATVSKSFKVGDTISKSDITVKDNVNNTITDYSFSSYQFTYADAESGGNLTNKEFNISYNEMDATLSVLVYREECVEQEQTLKTYPSTGFSTLKTTYTTNQSITVEGTAFIVDGYYYKSGSKLSLSNGSSSAPGMIKNSSPYSTGIMDVSFTGATPDVQLSVDGSNWVDLESANQSTVNYFYFKAFYKTTAQSGYVNISSFEVTLKGEETATNVANYIMYEDTNNQCNSKLDIAIMMFENLSTAGRNTFMTSSDYVIATARERLEAWALNQNKTIDHVNGDYVINARINYINRNNYIILIIVITTVVSFSIASLLLMNTRKKRLNRR